MTTPASLTLDIGGRVRIRSSAGDVIVLRVLAAKEKGKVQLEFSGIGSGGVIVATEQLTDKVCWLISLKSDD
jgi:hypothetical protein